MPVPTTPNAVVGVYANPSPNATTMVAALTASTDTYGARCRKPSRANAYGKTPMRPIAYEVRVETFTPAFAFATVELTIARKTRIQNSPYSVRAMPSQESLPEAPKPANLSGPKATSTAYVVKM